MSQKIILIGPMGAGKTAIGRQLARRFGLPFRDTDEVIQQRTGVDIPLIFELEGEEGFRRREEIAVADLAAGPGAVIATGGGVVLSAKNRTVIHDAGTVVFLETSVEWQLARTGRSRHRPLLDTEDPASRLESLYAQREALYRDCAHVTVNTDGKRVNAVARDIIRRLGTNAGATEE